ncbi:C25 family cysteine peptidase [Herpetosiphon geysericola]|uniref:C25 family cysteine peptidase n=1 Tax=Herpetosiphon geysericola TaxID=70996 RepID=UPI001EED6E09|nr:C25 family cysteine peptidase [Herpetosiphon geysericola]
MWVYQVQPTIQQQGQIQQVTQLNAMLDNAVVVESPADLQALPRVPFGDPVPPTNPLAFDNHTWTLTVTTPGMQRVTGAMLAAAGIDLATLNPAMVQVQHAGMVIPLDWRGVGDGVVDPHDEVRLWVDAVGDRWNQTTTLWLTTAAATPSPPMTSRLALDSTAPLTNTVWMTSTWDEPQLIESRHAGVRGWHTFSRRLNSLAGGTADATTMLLTPTLPLASGLMTVTLTGATVTSLPVSLVVNTVPMRVPATSAWHNSVAMTTTAALTITLPVPASGAASLLLETVMVTRPMRLTTLPTEPFWSGPTPARYALPDAPPLRTLYDVTEPAQPQIVILPAGQTPILADSLVNRRYLLVGHRPLPMPRLQRHIPIVLPTAGADVIIAPRVFLHALEPLRTPTTVLVAREDLDAAWAFGQMSPDALRSFLRHAAATWPTPPTSVLFVGDGTADPRDVLGYGQITLIPPLLAEVDLWLGETACESCYGQLDGADPLDDLLPDLPVGRWPVKSIAELTALIAKQQRYTAAPWGVWQSTVGSVADNAEGALEFPQLAAQSEAVYPLTMTLHRAYYVPQATTADPAWHVADAQAVRERVLAIWNTGVTIMQYIGHSHAYQWAVTDPLVEPRGLLDLNAVSTLQNSERLPLLLALTCLTSAFQQPSPRGTTLDEALVLHPDGGAIATWGSSGLGVAHGHDHLQHGLVTAALTIPQPTLGQITEAGLLQLALHGQCCTDALRTTVLLGNPATVLHIAPAPQRVWASLVMK